MKKLMTTGLLFAFIFSSVLLTESRMGWGDTGGDGLTPTVKTKTHKKTKKKAKKAKAQKVKVAKSSAGEQDEVSDQIDVSQQADSSGKSKKR